MSATLTRLAPDARSLVASAARLRRLRRDILNIAIELDDAGLAALMQDADDLADALHTEIQRANRLMRAARHAPRPERRRLEAVA